MKLHQINCLFAKNVMIPNKIVYKPRWECVSFLSRALVSNNKNLLTLGEKFLLLGSIQEWIMTASETSSEKTDAHYSSNILFIIFSSNYFKSDKYSYWIENSGQYLSYCWDNEQIQAVWWKTPQPITFLFITRFQWTKKPKIWFFKRYKTAKNLFFWRYLQ
jgi:hypothetical protein